MNAIIGFTGIAMKNNPSDEVKNCLEKIDESSEHLLSLINDVLQKAFLQTGISTLRFSVKKQRFQMYLRILHACVMCWSIF